MAGLRQMRGPVTRPPAQKPNDSPCGDLARSPVGTSSQGGIQVAAFPMKFGDATPRSLLFVVGPRYPAVVETPTVG